MTTMMVASPIWATCLILTNDDDDDDIDRDDDDGDNYDARAWNIIFVGCNDVVPATWTRLLQCSTF